MKRYTIIHPLFMSFFSKSLYQDVGRNWKGLCFMYLLLLLAFCWVPSMIKLYLSISDFVTNHAPEIVKQIPAIKFSHGEISTDESRPYFIKDPKSSTLLMIIDTTGQFTSLEGSAAIALLTKNKIMAKKSGGETRILDLSQAQSYIDEFSVDQSRIYSWLEIFKNWFAIVSYPFALLFSFLYRVIQVLIYAAIGILFAKTLHTTLSYQASIRLAVISITPVLLLDTIRGLMDISVPFWWLISFLIAMSFLFYAVKVNSEITEAA